MKPYRVRFFPEDQNGREEYMEFDTMEQAMELYDSLGGQAEIQMHDGERGCYEAVLYPTFEF